MLRFRDVQTANKFIKQDILNKGLDVAKTFHEGGDAKYTYKQVERPKVRYNDTVIGRIGSVSQAGWIQVQATDNKYFNYFFNQKYRKYLKWGRDAKRVMKTYSEHPAIKKG